VSDHAALTGRPRNASDCSAASAWVNNAGVSIFGPIRETLLEDQRQPFRDQLLGLRSQWLAGRRRHLRTQRGSGTIVNIGSTLSDALAHAGPGHLFGVQTRGKGLHQCPADGDDHQSPVGSVLSSLPPSIRP
jgi:NAD(P)-dependent dehydrogenase (short-subunit alcohol dehydrogenase family)